MTLRKWEASTVSIACSRASETSVVVFWAAMGAASGSMVVRGCIDCETD
jgi:hypothetical protein